MVQPRTKYINIRYHFSRQAVKSGKFKLIYCPTEIMIADTLTKAWRHICKFCKIDFNSRHITPLERECWRSSKRMQAEGKHKARDRFSQAGADPDVSKQYSDSFPHISFKSQHVISPWNIILSWGGVKSEILIWSVRTSAVSSLWKSRSSSQETKKEDWQVSQKEVLQERFRQVWRCRCNNASSLQCHG